MTRRILVDFTWPEQKRCNSITPTKVSGDIPSWDQHLLCLTVCTVHHWNVEVCGGGRSSQLPPHKGIIKIKSHYAQWARNPQYHDWEKKRKNWLTHKHCGADADVYGTCISKIHTRWLTTNRKLAVPSYMSMELANSICYSSTWFSNKLDLRNVIAASFMCRM